MLGWLFKLIVGDFKQCSHQLEDVEKLDIILDGKIKGVVYVQKCKRFLREEGH